MEKKLFYFGCYQQKGHFLYGPGGHSIHNYNRVQLPGLNTDILTRPDAIFPPQKYLSGYNESIVPPVRIVSWWDTSLDHRPGSNSTLIGYGYDTGEQMLDDAEINFPN